MKTKTYTAWGKDDKADTLIEGEGPPKFANGELQDPQAQLVWRIEATDWVQANQKYHELQGWEPYQPMEEDRGTNET
tara:strand:+ start:2168 stop:2398 length:231 start_codon:yes stop_codon:yes gene_type:complete